jgi:hypothetical protein
VAPGGNDSNNCQTPATACAAIRNDDDFRQLLPLIQR